MVRRVSWPRALSVALGLFIGGTAQAANLEGPAQAPRYPTVKTPMGLISVVKGALTLDGLAIPNSSQGHPASHISTHYLYPQQTDVLVQYVGGDSCPALFRWYSITPSSITRSPEFGSCSDQISVDKGSHNLTVTTSSFGPAAVNGRYVYDGQTLTAYEPLGTASPPKRERAQMVWNNRPSNNRGSSNTAKAPDTSRRTASQQATTATSQKSQSEAAIATYYRHLKDKAAKQQSEANAAWQQVQRSSARRDERYKTVPFDPDADPLFFVKMAQLMQCDVREGFTHEVNSTIAQFWQFAGGCMDDGLSQAYGAVIVLFSNGTGRLAVLMSPHAADRVLRELHGG